MKKRPASASGPRAQRPAFGSKKAPHKGKSPKRETQTATKGKSSKPQHRAHATAPGRPHAVQHSKPNRLHEKKQPTDYNKRDFKSKPGSSLLWGVHAVREALLNPARRCHRIWTTDAGRGALDPILKTVHEKKLERPTPARMERSEMDSLLPRGAVHQGLLIEVDPLTETTLDDMLGADHAPSLILVLDQVTDPHNVGAILRSAAAFGAGAVIVTERNAPGETGTLAKAACGAAEHVKMIPVVNLARALDALRDESYWCIGLAEEGAQDLSHSALSDGRIALVLGAEGDGLRRLTREHCDELARLPTGGPIGSLNVSSAAAVALYEVKRQRS